VAHLDPLDAAPLRGSLDCGRLSPTLYGFRLLIPVSFGGAMASKWVDSSIEAVANSEVHMDAKGKSKLAEKIGRISFSTLLAMLAEAALGAAASG
jgi:hypothetical protein